MNEFELIRQYFAELGPKGPDLVLGVGDDCALIAPLPGQVLCHSLDTMVEGVHFPVDAPPEKLAFRALAAAVSDLAAMGAMPSYFLLSLTLPEVSASWLEGFARGLANAAECFGIGLIGGDTTRGPLNIAIQVSGYVDPHTVLRRDSAQVGDVVLVSGTLGDAGAALKLLNHRGALNAAQQFLLDRYYAPTPRLALGRELCGVANAALDISDGLVGDAAHIAQASQVRLVLDAERLPLSQALLECYPNEALSLALSAGDDYELLVTMSETNWLRFQNEPLASLLTAIGRVEAGSGVAVFHQGQAMDLCVYRGYQHFV